MPASVDLEKETVITGRVVDGDGQAVGGAFVRLLDSSDEFTAEGVRPATGYAEGSATSAPIWEMLLTSRSTWTPTRRQRGDFRCFRCPPR